MTGVGRRPVHPFYNLFVNSLLNSLFNLCTFPRLFVALRNRLAFFIFSFRRPLKSRRAATVAYHIKRNVPTSRNGPISVNCNLPSPPANIYYYLLFLPSRPLIYLQYIALL